MRKMKKIIPLFMKLNFFDTENTILKNADNKKTLTTRNILTKISLVSFCMTKSEIPRVAIPVSESKNRNNADAVVRFREKIKFRSISIIIKEKNIIEIILPVLSS